MNKFIYIQKSFILSAFFLLNLFSAHSVQAATYTAGTETAFKSLLLNSSMPHIVNGDIIQLTGDIIITTNITIPNFTFTVIMGAYNLTIASGVTVNSGGQSSMTVTDGVPGHNSIVIQKNTSPTFTEFAVDAGGLQHFYNTVLPIEFQSFNATHTGKSVSLIWLVSEDKTDAFTIERSSDGKSFDNIGSMKVISHTETPQYFSFTDEKPLAVISYYRIKSTEWSGNVFYSKSIAVMGKNGVKTTKVYPNPVGTDGELNIATTGDIQNIIITNALGQVVLTSNVPKTNIAHLAKGYYNVTVKTNVETVTEKFFKQ